MIAAALASDAFLRHATDQPSRDFEQEKRHAQQDDPQHQVSRRHHSGPVFPPKQTGGKGFFATVAREGVAADARGGSTGRAALDTALTRILRTREGRLDTPGSLIALPFPSKGVRV